jgi:hypothetical protein
VLKGRRIGDEFTANLDDVIERRLVGGGALMPIGGSEPEVVPPAAEPEPEPEPAKPEPEIEQHQPKSPRSEAKR